MDVDWKKVQTVLGVTSDGMPGPATRAALVSWQAAHGLDADGVMGPKTYAAMFPEQPKLPQEIIAPATDTSGIRLTRGKLLQLCPKARTDLVDTIMDGLPDIVVGGISSNLRLAMFLGEVATETGGLRAIEENLNYS